MGGGWRLLRNVNPWDRPLGVRAQFGGSRGNLATNGQWLHYFSAKFRTAQAALPSFARKPTLLTPGPGHPDAPYRRFSLGRGRDPEKHELTVDGMVSKHPLDQYLADALAKAKRLGINIDTLI